MKSIKRLSILLVVAMLMSMILGGCGSSAGETEEDTEETVEETEEVTEEETAEEAETEEAEETEGTEEETEGTEEETEEEEIEEETEEAEEEETETTDAEEEETSGTRIITDMAGVEVEIPAEVNTYVDSWFAHNAVVLMLDDCEGLVGTVNTPESQPWQYYICENMYNATYIAFSEDMNLEEVLALEPDVVFGSSESYRELIEGIGIPYINCNFKTYDEMIQSIEMTAEILGEDAEAIAEEYVEYLSERIDWVTEIVSAISDDEKLTVLHGESVYTYSVDGANTIIDEWITTAGGINAAAEDVEGNKQTVTMEQILLWDPDVIITGTYGEAEEILSDPTWASLTAVQNGNVYDNPKGIFAWDRYGVEEALQFQWTAKLLYPDLFEDFSIEDEIKYFYETFLTYELTDEEVELILAHMDPVTE